MKVMGYDNTDISVILENLEKLEVELLNYEESLNSSEQDSSYIHRIFRHAHNLKSMLAMSDKEKSSKLMHVLESCFDYLRKGEKLSNSVIIQNSLYSVDIIRSNIELPDDNIETINSQIEKFDKILSSREEIGAGKETIKIPSDIKISKKDIFNNNLNKFYLAEKLIKTDIDKTVFDLLPIYQDIAEIGSLLYSSPKFEDIPKTDEFFVLNLVFSSEKNPDEVEYYIFDPFRAVEIEFDDKPKKNFIRKKEINSPIRVLIVEDEFFSRLVIQEILSEYGKCDIAVNGIEAVDAVKMRVKLGDPYDLICLDIMMPEMDGSETLVKIREIEKENGILGLDRAKIIMTTALDDMERVMAAFREQCDSYLVKPISVARLKNELYKLKIISKENGS